MDKLKLREYESLNLKPETKQRVDRMYYKAKMNKKYRSVDEFLNEVLDKLEEN